MIDFRMDTFIEVCKCLNYTKAAEHLGLTQPAVSQHIRYLENIYETKLFDYNNKKITMTETGKMLLTASMTMKNDEQYLKRAIKEKGMEAPSICFGVTLTVGEYCIPEKVAEYVKKNPGTKIRVIVDNTKELLESMNQGEIDFAIVEGNFSKDEYDSQLYIRQELAVVCAAGHRFKKNPEILTDLLSETLLLREKRSGGREVLERSLEGKNLRSEDFANVIEVSSIKTIKELAMRDCGITFLYEAAVEKELKERTLKKIKLEDFQIWHDMMFIWRKGSIFEERYKELFAEIMGVSNMKIIIDEKNLQKKA